MFTTGLRFWRWDTPPNWLWRGILCCPRTFCPAKCVLVGNLALPLDILTRQRGFGGVSLRINSIPIQKKPCCDRLFLSQQGFSCCILQRITRRSTDLILRVTFVIPIILKDYRFLFRCRPAHPQFYFHSTHS